MREDLRARRVLREVDKRRKAFQGCKLVVEEPAEELARHWEDWGQVKH